MSRGAMDYSTTCGRSEEERRSGGSELRHVEGEERHAVAAAAAGPIESGGEGGGSREAHCKRDSHSHSHSLVFLSIDTDSDSESHLHREQTADAQRRTGRRRPRSAETLQWRKAAEAGA